MTAPLRGLNKIGRRIRDDELARPEHQFRPPLRWRTRIILAVVVVALAIPLTIFAYHGFQRADADWDNHVAGINHMKQDWDNNVGRPDAASIRPGAAPVALPSVAADIDTTYWGSCSELPSCRRMTVDRYPIRYFVKAASSGQNCWDFKPRPFAGQLKGSAVTGSFTALLSADNSTLTLCSGEPSGQIAIWFDPV